MGAIALGFLKKEVGEFALAMLMEHTPSSPSTKPGWHAPQPKTGAKGAMNS